MISQVTQHLQIPLSYADAVIGTSGTTISYIRRSSGATVTVQESRGAPGEMTVEISGAVSQVQAAQQLIQNSMAGAGAPTQTQAGGAVDQGYNQGYGSYFAPGTACGAPATSTGYASQPGSYGSVWWKLWLLGLSLCWLNLAGYRVICSDITCINTTMVVLFL